MTDDDEPPPGVRLRVERRADRLGAEPHRRVGNEPDLSGRLQPQEAADVGVGHRVERMLLHAGCGEQRSVYEEMAVEERAARGREYRADDGAWGAERIDERLGDRHDIEFWRGIEG